MEIFNVFWVGKGLYFDVNAIDSPCGPRWNFNTTINIPLLEKQRASPPN